MSTDLEIFAGSVRGLAKEASEQDRWHPGVHADDRSERLSAGLARLGWADLATADDETRPFLAAAAFELGYAAASAYDIVQLLGGSPVVRGLAMYGGPGDGVVVPRGDRYHPATVISSTPVAFADSLGVHADIRCGAPEPAPDLESRSRAFEAALVGYFAGLTGFVVDTATEHARQRQVFGRTLAHLDAVQQRLADAATTADALALSCREGAHGLAALSYAASSAGTVMAHGHMIFGAVGFTLEFPLQRYSRRAKALAAFVTGWIDQRIERAA
jgi:hypothetical protein